MTQQLLDIFLRMGMTGLFVTMAFEGLSIPFPGIFVALTYGYLFKPGLTKLPLIALEMSLVYTMASFIPYLIGLKLEQKIKKRFQNKIQKAQNWFRIYGECSIALTRPFGVGNYISYVAGISKIKWWKYGLLTLVGIYPWSFATLFLGLIYKGEITQITEQLQAHREDIYLGLIIIIVVYACIVFVLNHNQETKV
ncbi:MAG: hypothetical protein PWQ96_1758 [Clostridia bacterium]|jgi:membrane protein DedA with SNARE-associated domain|nr:hypothetical protein [Clostridiales bacterium]MDK2986114.1 hypothetical protein [Clostridia bacterium]